MKENKKIGNSILSKFNKISWLLFLLFFMLSFSESKAQSNAIRLKVMSFNVCRSGELTQYSVAPFANLIRQYQPDFIALQELDYKTTRNTGIDFLTKLGAALNMFPVFGRTIFYQGGEYGIAVLSKYPFLLVKTEPLPSPAGTKEQRAVLITEIRLPSGQDIRFVSTHLDHSTDAVGSEMARALNNLLLKDDMPIILGGDFNARPETGTIANEMQSWKRFCNNDPTSPDNPTSKIDYLFGYPKEKCRTISYQVIARTGISDHCPIVAEIEFQ
ncbi:MAG: endonuclease/exonuclease/phosphatase family protein [Prolixibacteraceae bacterium]|nr:endonuclease/exonuclease/phosphatase family protein [Prolixibacteraceae bacterium]